jgi:hypothetical protein
MIMAICFGTNKITPPLASVQPNKQLNSLKGSFYAYIFLTFNCNNLLLPTLRKSHIKYNWQNPPELYENTVAAIALPAEVRSRTEGVAVATGSSQTTASASRAAFLGGSSPLRGAPRTKPRKAYSHSIVAGGLPLMS